VIPMQAFDMPSLRTKLIWLIPLSLACTDGLAADLPSADRVVSAVDVDKRVTLSERRAQWVSPANDIGAVPDDLPLTHLSLVLKRSPERQAAFDQLLRDQQDPTSPNFQHWLTPLEIGERFGATQHDVDAISEWLRSRGLNIYSVSNARTRIRFSGNAAAVSAAFTTSLRFYRAGA